MRGYVAGMDLVTGIEYSGYRKPHQPGLPDVPELKALHAVSTSGEALCGARTFELDQERVFAATPQVARCRACSDRAPLPD